MNWLRIDDAFEDHDKVEPLSDGAHRLWMRAACWCKQPERPEHVRLNGIVPRAMLVKISKNKVPLKLLEKHATELVAADGGGEYEQGLWLPVEGDGEVTAWRFHDWHKYQPPELSPTEAHEAKVEAGRLGGIRSAVARRSKHGSAQPKAPPKQASEAHPKQPPEAELRSTAEAAPKPPEAPDPGPGPGPGPGQRAADAAPDAAAVSPDTKIRCPVPVEIPPDTMANLTMGVGMPEPVAAAFLWTWSLKQNAKATDIRTLDVWRATAVAALTGEWSNADSKAKMRAAAEPKQEPPSPEETRFRRESEERAIGERLRKKLETRAAGVKPATPEATQAAMATLMVGGTR